MNILVDANIIMDSLFEFRSNHALAIELLESLPKKHIIHMPAHSWFELCSAVMCEFKNDKTNFDKYNIFRGLKDFQIKLIDINKKFNLHHLKSPFPNLKSADMIYGVIAIHDRIPLITEDIKLRKEVKRFGGNAYNTKDALKKFVHNA